MMSTLLSGVQTESGASLMGVKAVQEKIPIIWVLRAYDA